MMKKSKPPWKFHHIFTRRKHQHIFYSPREGGGEKPIFEILGIKPIDFPPAECLKRRQLERKFHRLIRILNRHRFFCEFSPLLPLRESYRYLSEVFIYENEIPNPSGWNSVVTGCTGDCLRCFQKEYCNIFPDFIADLEKNPRFIKDVLSSKKPS